MKAPEPPPPPPTSKTETAVIESGTRHPPALVINVLGIRTTVYGPDVVVDATLTHCVLNGVKLYRVSEIWLRETERVLPGPSLKSQYPNKLVLPRLGATYIPSVIWVSVLASVQIVNSSTSPL